MSQGAVLEKGLPVNLDAERYILGSVILQEDRFPDVAGGLHWTDFSVEKHKLIYLTMAELFQSGAKIDRLTLANRLAEKGKLEACDGLGYLVSLDDGLPHIENLGSYIEIVRQKAALRRLAFLGQTLQVRALTEPDPAAIANSIAAELLADPHPNANQHVQTTAEIIDAYPGGINAMFSGVKQTGLATGFARYDEYTGGLHRGELVIIAARPSMGKTALALNMAERITRLGKRKALVFSLEMSAQSLLTRMICASARLDSHRFRMGTLSAEERLRGLTAASALAESGLYIDDSGAIAPMDILSRCRRQKLAKGLDVVFIDYLQLIAADQRSENRNLEVGKMSRAFKLLAKDLDIPVVLLSQLSRAPEHRGGDHRPQLADLRDSGTIEQDADTVAFIFREEVYKPDREDLKGLADLIIAKQRNGPTGTVPLVFLRQFTRFENRAWDMAQDMAPAGTSVGHDHDDHDTEGAQ